MRILIVEDHQLLRQGLIECLKHELSDLIFGEANSAREAKRRMAGAPWDLVLLDLALPDGSGFDLLACVKGMSPAPKVIVLTASAEEDCGIPALKGGADGFVMKTAPFSDLAKAILSVGEGRRYFSMAIIEGVLTAASQGENISSKFSARELDTLRLTAEGLSTDEIGDCLNISPKTVETYRARICQKLEIRGFASFLRFAVLNRRQGFAWDSRGASRPLRTNSRFPDSQ